MHPYESYLVALSVKLGTKRSIWVPVALLQEGALPLSDKMIMCCIYWRCQCHKI